MTTERRGRLGPREFARRAPVWYGCLGFFGFYAVQAMVADITFTLSGSPFTARSVKWALGAAVFAVVMVWIQRRTAGPGGRAV